MNLIGEIPGTDLRDEVVMLGGYSDTRRASANTGNIPSGVAAALEAIVPEDLMKNATIMASYNVYHAAMADERVPRKP
jgi:hypothetical protein